MTPAPQQIAGYRLLKVLGRGGMGCVYLAQDEALDRRVALKVLRADVLDPEALERMAREAQVVVNHPHPALVPLLDADLAHSPPYMVLQLMEGGPLPVRPGEAAARLAAVGRVGARLADGLAHLHSHGVLHRDVKPANVLLDAQGEAYLADLGLARHAADSPLTQTGCVVGTPRYMAPEVLGQGRYGPASDVYALAMTLLEYCLGRTLDPLSLPEGGLQDAAREVPDAALRQVLLRGLRTDPESRIQDAGTLRDLLEGPPQPAAPPQAARPSSTGGARLPPPTRIPAPPPRWPLVLGLLGMLVAGPLGFVQGRARPSPVPAPVPAPAAAGLPRIEALPPHPESLLRFQVVHTAPHRIRLEGRRPPPDGRLLWYWTPAAGDEDAEVALVDLTAVRSGGAAVVEIRRPGTPPLRRASLWGVSGGTLTGRLEAAAPDLGSPAPLELLGPVEEDLLLRVGDELVRWDLRAVRVVERRPRPPDPPMAAGEP